MSVYCTRNTHFLYIEKQDFDRVIEMWSRRIESERINFLKEIEAFKLLNNSRLKALLDQFKPLSKIRGSFLFREGDSADSIYLIRSGEFTITKKVYF